MIEFTHTKTPREIMAYGYKDLGIFKKGCKQLDALLLEGSIKKKCDLILLSVDKEGEILHTFMKEIHL